MCALGLEFRSGKIFSDCQIGRFYPKTEIEMLSIVASMFKVFLYMISKYIPNQTMSVPGGNRLRDCSRNDRAWKRSSRRLPAADMVFDSDESPG
jgi:hypothetical protein